MNEVKSKKPKLKLVGKDGNAYSILARARNAAKKAGWSDPQINEFMIDAKSGDYDHLLQTVMKHFDVY